MSALSAIEKLLSLLPWKSKGYEVLGKYKSSDVRAGDARVLAEMLARHTDFSKSRHVIHYLYFQDETGRTGAAKTLSERGYTTRYGVDCDGAYPKSLIAERHGVVDEALIDQERALLSRISTDNHGDYDGWEAALD